MHLFRMITKEIGADIKATSMPILDTTQSKELVGQLVTDIVLAIFAYVAEEDKPTGGGLSERHELQCQGIEVAKNYIVELFAEIADFFITILGDNVIDKFAKRSLLKKCEMRMMVNEGAD